MAFFLVSGERRTHVGGESMGVVVVGPYTKVDGTEVAGYSYLRGRKYSESGSDDDADGSPADANGPEGPKVPPDRGHGASTGQYEAEQRLAEARVALGVGVLQHSKGKNVDLAALRQDVTRAGEDVAGQQRCPKCGQFQGARHRCPVPEGMPAADYSGMNQKERVEAMVGDLESAVTALVSSGQLHRWLAAMASNGLSRWSFNNRLAATIQMIQRGHSLEEPLHMMGFKQWGAYGRAVVKGAKAVWILAPVTKKIVEEDDAGHERTVSRTVGFKAVPVYDICETQGDPMPTLPLVPGGEEATPGTLVGLQDRVGQAGYTYEEQVIAGANPKTGQGTLGYTEPGTRRIVVEKRLTGAQKASVIAHELGHVHCGHVEGMREYNLHRGRMETEAEMTAYLVNRARGMTQQSADSFSPAYIAAWSKGDSAVMKQAMEKAVRAFNTIMDGTWPP